jgi:hypothetical protein
VDRKITPHVPVWKRYKYGCWYNCIGICGMIRRRGAYGDDVAVRTPRENQTDRHGYRLRHK